MNKWLSRISCWLGQERVAGKVPGRRVSRPKATEVLESRLMLAGDLDVSFGTAGKVLTDFGTTADEAAAITIDSSNRILVAGTVLTGTGDTDFALARYTSAGVLDTTFGTSGKVTTSFNTFFQRVYDIAVQSDGKIVVVGSTHNGSNYDFGLTRYHSNGTLDNTFDDNGLQTVNFGGDDVARAIAIQADGKIIVAGETLVSGQKEIVVARLNPADGQLDTSFGSVGKVTTAISTGDDYANDVVIQGDGRIVIGGTSWNGTYQVPLLARYSSTGTLDTSFDENGLQSLLNVSGNAVLSSILIQPDGKIVGAGTSSAGTGDFLVMRVLGSNGAFDTTFNSTGSVITSLGTGSDRVASVVRASDGTLIISGTSASGVDDDFAWARYSASGVLDTSFAGTGFYKQSIGTGNDIAAGSVILGSGQFLVAGYSTDSLGRSDFAMVRVNTSNTTPTDLTLSSASVVENVATGTIVGGLSTTDFDGTAFTYSLVSGTGSTDNASFAISGSSLVTNTAINFESKNSYSVRIRTTDAAGATFEKVFTISVTNINESPSNIILSNAVVSENQPAATTVGTFSTTDPDVGDSFVYTLVTGAGDADNTSFTIDGNTLKTGSTFDFEAKSSYSIRLRTADVQGLIYEKSFTITVSDVDDISPTVISTSFLTSGTLAANATTLTVTFSEPVSFAIGSQQRPGLSATHIKTLNPAAADGVYWIDPNGGSPADAFQVYCDMTTDGGGWMLAINSVSGDEPSTASITSNTGTPSLTTAHTRNLNSYFAGSATAEIRHQVHDTQYGYGIFDGKYVADDFEQQFSSMTSLTPFNNGFLLEGSFNASFGAAPGGGNWFYRGSNRTTVPVSPSISPAGPYSLYYGVVFNAYRVWIRGTNLGSPQSAIGGGELTTNYELRRAGTDSLLLGSDAPINPASVSSSGNTTTLTFAALAEDSWRLTVRDSIMDASGNALDGDGNGTEGGHWQRDLVVGALSTRNNTPSSFMIDPEIGGFGAGQIVEGSANSFDGYGRLSIGGNSFSPAPSSLPATSLTRLMTTSTLSVPANATTTIPSLSYTATAAGDHRVSGHAVLQYVNSPTNARVSAALFVNGNPLQWQDYSLTIGGSTNYTPVEVEQILTLMPGDVIDIRLLSNVSSISLALADYGSNSGTASLRVERVNLIPGSGPSLTTTSLSTPSTLSIPGGATTQIPNLEFTASSTGEYRISGNAVLQYVNAPVNAIVFFALYVDGIYKQGRDYSLARGSAGVTSYTRVEVEELLSISTGSKVTLRVYSSVSGISLSLVDYGANGGTASLRVELFNQLPLNVDPLALSRVYTTTHVNIQANSSTAIPGLSFTVPVAGDYRISGHTVLQYSNAPINARVSLGLFVDGVARQSRDISLTLGHSFYWTYTPIDIEDFLTLSPGSKVELRVVCNVSGIQLQLANYGSNLGTGSLRISKSNDLVYPITANDGQSLILPLSGIAGLTASRTFTVPATGATDFTRTVDTLTNPTASPITVPIRLVGNLGSDAATSVFATSDGDLIVEPTDLWFGTDDADGTGTPAIIHLLHGPFGLPPSSVNVIEDNVEWTYDLTVPAGATKRLASFTVLGTTRAQTIAAANTLVTSTGFGGEAAAFLTSEELASLANFEFNTAPSDLQLSGSTVVENAEPGSEVGVLTTIDADAGDSFFTYAIVSGAGDSSNDLFAISDGTIQVVGPFDNEEQSTHSIRVRTTDALGASFEKTFEITITDAPTRIHEIQVVAQLRHLVTGDVLTGTHTVDFQIFTQQSGGTLLWSGSNNSVNVQSVTEGYLVQSLQELAAIALNAIPSDAWIQIVVDGQNAGNRFALNGAAVQTTAGNVRLTNAMASTSTRDGDDVPGGLRIPGIMKSTGAPLPNDGVPWVLNLFSAETGGVTGYTDTGIIDGLNDAGGRFVITPGGTIPFDPGLITAFPWVSIEVNGYTLPQRIRIDGGEVSTSSGSVHWASVHASRSWDVESSSPLARGTFNSWLLLQDATSFLPIAGTRNLNVQLFNAASGGTLLHSESSVINISPHGAGSFVSSIGSETAFAFDILRESEHLWIQVSLDGVGAAERIPLTLTSRPQSVRVELNEAPDNIGLSGTTISENLPIGTAVGSLTTADPDSSNTFTYSLVAGTDDADNASFTIDGNTLKAAAAFNFEAKNSYSIRVRSTDQGGLFFEKVFTISVTDVDEDVTAPVSLITALAAASNSLSIPISVTGNDPGAITSGVKEYDLYYSTGGAFVKFATVPAASPSTTFTGAANTTYWFRSLGRDNAGNVETKTTSDTYTRIGDVVAPVTLVTSAVPNSSGLFTVQMTGTKVSGTALTVFDVYVSIDGNAPVLVGSANGVALGSGNYSGQILFQGALDGTSHTYRFYSRGRDGSGNVEAAPASGDVSVTYSFASAGLTATAIDVQNGVRQRSYVRYLDVLFSSATGLDAMLTDGRVKVERFAIDAASVTPGSGVDVPGALLSQSGNRLRLDFGANGLGGLRQAGNGFYRVLLNLDGNSSFADAGDAAFEFHRLFGDADGNGIVDIADTNLVTSQIGRTGSNLDGDLDGNNAVNSTDRLYTTQQRGKKLLEPLLGWLDD